MLMQPRNTTDFEFSQNISLSLLQSLQASAFRRKTIVLQPPPLDGLSSSTKPAIDTPLTNTLLQFKEKISIHQKFEPMLPELSVTRESLSEKSDFSPLSPKNSRFPIRSKVITKNKPSDQVSKGKKIYEISRFFVKNYVGALKSTLSNPQCEPDIMNYLSCSREHIHEIKEELEKLLKENPKHNRMQLYKLIVNPVLNPIFQYFLRRKVVSWIFTSSKMQDRQAHLMARKNFLYLCLKAKELTPYNFKIALNFK